MSPVELRELVPRVLSVQEALIRALSAWDADPPSDPEGWLITVSWRAFLDMARGDTARRDREDRLGSEPPTGAVPSADDTLRLYLLCAHPDLTASSAGAVAPGRTEGSCRWPSRTAAAGTPGSSRRGSRSCRPPWRGTASASTRSRRRSPLHADASRFEDTDWVQILEWYDELLRFADTPITRLNRAVGVGEADGAPAGLAVLAEVEEGIPRREAVAAHLHERNGDLELAARLYASAARNAPNLAEPDHQTREAARLNQLLRTRQHKT